ncbi:TOBE domain-containing protein [Acidithiobacillus sp.]|jgi:molybdopterin-binding protein|uniref:TOBE domain-containing protein n=1 Tax=Acidithiobacillus sp. TaxID=1872118 RepID=UPI003D092CFA
MNRLRGQIVEILSAEHLSLVDVAVGPDCLSAVLLASLDEEPLLRVGQQVDLCFKETELGLAKGLQGRISLRNRLPVRVEEIRRGVVLSEIWLDYRGQVLRSVITSRSAERLELRPGDLLEALIKANEVAVLEDGHAF